MDTGFVSKHKQSTCLPTRIHKWPRSAWKEARPHEPSGRGTSQLKCATTSHPRGRPESGSQTPASAGRARRQQQSPRKLLVRRQVTRLLWKTTWQARKRLGAVWPRNATPGQTPGQMNRHVRTACVHGAHGSILTMAKGGTTQTSASKETTRWGPAT